MESSMHYLRIAVGVLAALVALPSAASERATKLQRDLILAFFNKHLKNIDVDLRELENEYPEITISKN